MRVSTQEAVKLIKKVSEQPLFARPLMLEGVDMIAMATYAVA